MATLVEGMPARSSGLAWSGIFGGTFVFLAIEVTFGVLGAAIFATATNPNSANPVGPGVSAGFGIWMIVLSIIAMYFGGKAAGRLSSRTTRADGTYVGLVTFGMCIFTSILIVTMSLSSTAAGAAVQANATARNVVDVVTTGGYWLFVALVLAMIAAAIGGSHGARPDVQAIGVERDTVRPDIRKVA
jgi:amino acid transporter